MKRIETSKNWPTFSSLEPVYSKNSQNFNVDKFFLKNFFDIINLLNKEC